MSNSSIKTIAKFLIPRWLVNWYYHVSGQTIQFKGVYPNWQAAVKDAKGYDEEAILQQVIAKTQLIVTGKAAYERDGVVFDKPEYSYPLLALLLRAASEKNNKLTVLDFGGSLGSSYYQCRSFLQGIDSLKWCVVEQSHFVEAGNTYFADDILSFYNTIADSISHYQPDVVLFSGVLQYLPEPFVILQETISSKADYIVIDRNPFIVKGNIVLSLQKVPKQIVDSSYPVWLFNESEFKRVFSGKYSEIATFNALDGTVGHGRLKADFKGIIYSRMKEKKAIFE
jgi:putative methyltransferase (TIGR04325 family)